mmetsp:Transcript_62621/g.97457  ORF Transcript_62621/g.97457 Transcript_62621/m.97457 type:complete len:193 (+) Transcript_62621:73-651(+)
MTFEVGMDESTNSSLAGVLKSFPPPTHMKPKKATQGKSKRGQVVIADNIGQKHVQKDFAKAERSPTTVMIRHIACRYTQAEVVAVLDGAGFSEKYDIVHVPSNPSRKANLGYVFVNFVSPQYVEECRIKFDGQVFGPSCTTKKCEVSLAHMQGYAMTCQRAGMTTKSKTVCDDVDVEVVSVEVEPDTWTMSL